MKMNLAAWISNNAFTIAIIIIFVILCYKLLEWYSKNQDKIDKFMSKFKKHKGGIENK